MCPRRWLWGACGRLCIPLWTGPFAARCFAFLGIVHLLNSKGVTAIVYDGIPARLLREPAPGHNQEERLDHVNTFLKG